MEIILIDTGVFQKYIHDNIRNLKAFGNYNITVITDKSLSNNSFKLLEFEATTGVEQAHASNTGKPNPSYSDGNTKSSAPARCEKSSSSGKKSKNITLPSSLSSFTNIEFASISCLDCL